MPHQKDEKYKEKRKIKKCKKIPKKWLTNENVYASIRKVAEGTRRTQRLGSICKGDIS